MYRIGQTILIGVALSTIAASSFGGSAPSLRFDPFRPKPEVVDGTRASKTSSTAQDFDPILFSTVVGGESSLVNFGGEILEVGEETHGYRLLEVLVFSATFKKDGKTLRFEVVSGERVVK